MQFKIYIFLLSLFLILGCEQNQNWNQVELKAANDSIKYSYQEDIDSLNAVLEQKNAVIDSLMDQLNEGLTENESKPKEKSSTIVETKPEGIESRDTREK